MNTQDKLAELKAANPEQEYKDRVKAVAEAWKVRTVSERGEYKMS